jgi:hypothetical protein
VRRRATKACGSWSPEKFDFCLAEPDGIGGRRRYRPVDAEHRNLEGVSGPDRIAEHDAIRHIEALDRGRARPAGCARQLSLIIDIDGEDRLGARRLEPSDLAGIVNFVRNQRNDTLPPPRLAPSAAGAMTGHEESSKPRSPACG